MVASWDGFWVCKLALLPLLANIRAALLCLRKKQNKTSLHTLHPLDCPDVSVCMIPVEHVLASLMEGPGLHISIVFELFLHAVYTKVQLLLPKADSRRSLRAAYRGLQRCCYGPLVYTNCCHVHCLTSQETGVWACNTLQLVHTTNNSSLVLLLIFTLMKATHSWDRIVRTFRHLIWIPPSPHSPVVSQLLFLHHKTCLSVSHQGPLF